MGHVKRELDFAIELTVNLLADIASSTNMDLRLDALTVRRRVNSEGWSFLTTRLPGLGRAMDIACSKSETKMDYTGFKTRAGYPVFLGDLFRLVFDNEGYLRQDASVSIVKYLRQILYFWYKYELPYTTRQKADLESRFIEVETSLPTSLPTMCPVLEHARRLIGTVTSSFDKEAVIPSHGPGAVATKERVYEKFLFKRRYRCLETCFPFVEYMAPCPSFWSYHEPEALIDLEYGTARAVFVPKDSRGPRLISCEPLEFQYIQQGVSRELVKCIDSHPITSGRVLFRDQSVNGRYALWGSAGGGWVTLDMSDASDRVSTVLVDFLFGSRPDVLATLHSCRTVETVLPSGKLVSLRKFAPMGSALCFPVEALVFYALAVGVLVQHGGYLPFQAEQRIHVYGDDIICHLEDYEMIMQYFPYVGLKFNDKKCCTGGFFRESCGVDAFKGENVTPLKLRTRWLSSRPATSIVSWIEYSNSLYARGYWLAAECVRSQVGDFPVLDFDHKTVEFLHYRRHLDNLHTQRRSIRWNARFCRMEILASVAKGHVIKRRLPEWQRLFLRLLPNKLRPVCPRRNVLRPHPSLMDRFDALVPPRVSSDTHPVRRRVTLTRRWCLL